MNPILRFIDRLIRQHPNLICGLFVYVDVPLTAWYLGRRMGRKKRKQDNTFILVARPPGKSFSPVSRWTFESDDVLQFPPQGRYPIAYLFLPSGREAESREAPTFCAFDKPRLGCSRACEQFPRQKQCPRVYLLRASKNIEHNGFAEFCASGKRSL